MRRSVAPRTAVVTGATGQDGYYLVRRLLVALDFQLELPLELVGNGEADRVPVEVHVRRRPAGERRAQGDQALPGFLPREPCTLNREIQFDLPELSLPLLLEQIEPLTEPGREVD